MATEPVKPESSLPNITVTYDADADVLLITNGEDTAFGDSIANGVAMFYDQDPGNAGALAVGMHIIGAQGALKPFVDAVLKQHRIEPPPQSEVIKETTADPAAGRIG